VILTPGIYHLSAPIRHLVLDQYQRIFRVFGDAPIPRPKNRAFGLGSTLDAMAMNGDKFTMAMHGIYDLWWL
jgi:hypothetical protein